MTTSTPTLTPEQALRLEGHRAGRHIAPHHDCPRCADLYRLSGPPMSRPMTVAAAAEYLEVDPATVRQAIARQALGANKFGSTLLLEADEVARYGRERNRR